VYLYEQGKVRYISAKTRSWEQAERFAQGLKDERDPVKVELAKIEAKKAARETGLEAPLDQWIAGFKSEGETAKSYEQFKAFVLGWAASQGLTMLSDVTADHLDAWVGTWTLAPNTQRFRQTKLRSFFRWCRDLGKIDTNPAVVLRPIKAENEEETQPLTSEQFRQLIDATYQYDQDRRVDKDRFGVDLRAVFLVMRWTGVRLVDALMLRRSSLVGNRLNGVDIQKTGDRIDRLVPDEVVEALNAVPMRKTMHPDQFFWSRQCDHRTLASMWTPRVRLINKCIEFKDDRDEPMRFHSHQLRDTYAIELLLAGMPLENVSRLLCHKSVRVTEKHYAPWVKARQQKLEAEMMAAMRTMGAKFGGD
jgi:integrase